MTGVCPNLANLYQQPAHTGTAQLDAPDRVMQAFDI